MKLSKMIFSNSKGMSLIEIVIGLGLTAIILLGVSSLMRMNTLTNKKVDANNALSLELNSLVDILSLQGDDLRSDLFDRQQTYFLNSGINIFADELVSGDFSSDQVVRKQPSEELKETSKKSFGDNPYDRSDPITHQSDGSKDATEVVDWNQSRKDATQVKVITNKDESGSMDGGREE